MVEKLLKRYSLISDQVSKDEVRTILNMLSIVLEKGIEGDIVEFGCYTGTTSLFISRLLKELDPSRAFHVYDSFSGLPEKSTEDSSPAGTQFVAGELSASKKQFVENYMKAGLPLPIIHKSWFSDLSEKDVPEKICFAFLDGDYYHSILDPWRLIKGSLSSGAVIAIDDYTNSSLPGVYKAVDVIAGNLKASIRSENTLALIQMP